MLFVRQIICSVFFSVVPHLERLRSRDEILCVSVVTAISDMKNALVGEGVEVVTLPIGIALDGSLDLDRQDSLTWFDMALFTRFEKVGHTTEDWAEKKVTTTRQSRQYTRRSVE